jgi:zinc transporter ZupT
MALGVARAESAELRGIKGPWLWTAAAIGAVAVVVAVVWKLSRRPGSFFVALLAGAAAASMIGAALVPLQAFVSDKASDLVFAPTSRGGATAAEAGAAQWLRRNSKPGDLIATNAHCIIQRDGLCDSRHFWLAALSERPVLIEGWSYSNQANRIALTTGGNPSLIPYWNREELAVNDAAFKSPTPATIERLRNAGVRWLYADNRAGEVSPALHTYVRLRHATLDATIYELR